MKFTFNGYEIDLKVRNLRNDKGTKTDTLHIINYISMLYRDSADLHESQFDMDMAEIQQKRANELYNICDKHHFYDDVR